MRQYRLHRTSQVKGRVQVLDEVLVTAEPYCISATELCFVFLSLGRVRQMISYVRWCSKPRPTLAQTGGIPWSTRAYCLLDVARRHRPGTPAL